MLQVCFSTELDANSHAFGLEQHHQGYRRRSKHSRWVCDSARSH